MRSIRSRPQPSLAADPRPAPLPAACRPSPPRRPRPRATPGPPAPLPARSPPPDPAPPLNGAEHLTVRDEEPTVLAVRPAQPSLGQPRQVGPCGQAVLDRAVPERRFGQPLRPRRAPPRPVQSAAITPCAPRRLNRGEPRRTSPGQQVPPGIRLAA